MCESGSLHAVYVGLRGPCSLYTRVFGANQQQSLSPVCCVGDDGHIFSVHNHAPGLTISIATKKW